MENFHSMGQFSGYGTDSDDGADFHDGAIWYDGRSSYVLVTAIITVSNCRSISWDDPVERML